MQYNKTNWVDNKTLINAERMNNIEDGIDQAYQQLSGSIKTINQLQESQEIINKNIYKGFSKEFSSNGEDIVVNNGLNGCLLGAKMQGQTIKNEIKTPLFDSKELFTMSYMSLPIKDGEATVELDGTKRSLVFIGCEEYASGTDLYYASLDLKLTSYVEGDNVITISIFGEGHSKKICDFKDCSIGEYQKHSIITSNVNWEGKRLGIHVGSSKNANCTYSFKNPIVINLTQVFGKGKEPTKEQCDKIFNGFLPYGLSSTKTTIKNNDKKYSVYNPIIKVGNTKIMKALKNTEKWVEISPYEARDIENYDYKFLDSEFNSVFDICDYIDLEKKVKVITTAVHIFNGSENWYMYGGHYYAYSSFVKGNVECISTWLVSDKFNKPKCESWIRMDNGVTRISLENNNDDPKKLKDKLKETPLVVRYKLAEPIETPLTEEEILQYEKQKDFYKLEGIGTACNSLEILESGEGIYTKNSSLEKLLYAESFSYKEASSNESTLYFELYLLNKMKNGTKNVLCSHFSLKNIQDKESVEEGFYVVYNTIYFRISKSKLKTPDVEGFKEWLDLNNVYIVYEQKEPTITNISKEAMFGIISTHEKNTFSFGEELKPNKASVSLPVNLENNSILELEKQIAELEYYQIINEV